MDIESTLQKQLETLFKTFKTKEEIDANFELFRKQISDGELYCKKQLYECNICYKVFNQKTVLDNHNRIHTGERPFKCHICLKRFKQKSNLSSHITIHSGKKQFKCNICLKIFNRMNNLSRHTKRIHSGEKNINVYEDKTQNITILINKNEEVMVQTQKEGRNNQMENNYNHKINEYNTKICMKSEIEEHDISNKECNIEDKYLNNLAKSEIEEHLNLFEKVYIKTEVTEEDSTSERHLAMNDIIKKETLFSEKIPPKFNIKNKRFKCQFCTKIFNRKDNLRTHMKTHKKTFKCEICGKIFKTKDILALHMKYHSEERPHICNICKKTFIIKSDLTKHVKIHLGDKQLSYTVCNKSCRREEHLKLQKHTLIHDEVDNKLNPDQSKQTDVKTDIEEVNNKTLNNENSASSKNFITGKTKKEKESYECNVCLKTFSKKCHLITHRIIHTGQKPYKCEICSKTFKQKGNLVIHSKIHTREKLHTCNICTKTFSRNSHLSDHMKIHTGVKPFNCSECTKTFATKNDLTRHFRTHTGEKPFTCRVCFKSFRLNVHLSRHAKTHI